MPAPIFIDLQVRGVKDVQKALQTVSQVVERNARTRVRGAAEAERAEVKSAKAAAKEQEREAKQKVRAMIASDREVSRARAQALRDLERAEERTNRTALQWVKRREREEVRAAKEVARVREQMSRTIGRSIGTGITKTITGTMGMATTALNVMGGFSIADSMRSVAKNKGLAQEIASAGSTGGKSFAAKDVLEAASKTGTREGLATEEILGGLSEFTAKTGELGKGLSLLERLGEMASATGSRFEDLASAAAEISASMPDADDAKIMETVRFLAGQGQLGAVEIKDLSKRAALVTASAGKFAGNKEANIVTLGALAQEAKARGGAANPAEATTAVARFADDVAKGKGKFSALGISTTTKEGVLRDPKSIVMDTLRTTKGDVSKITDLFGVRSAKAVQGFAEIYRNAGGGEAGEKAVEDEFARLEKAIMDEEEVRKKATLRREADDRKFESAMNELRDALGSELLPVIVKLVPQFRELIPQIVKLAQTGAHLVDWFVSNPFKGLGAMVGMQMTKEIVNAQIPKLFESKIGSIAANGFAIAAAAIAIESAGEIKIAQMADDDADKTSRNPIQAGLEALNATSELKRKVAEGTVTQEDIDKAKAAEGKLKGARDVMQNEIANPSTFDKLFSGKWMGDLAPQERKDAIAKKELEQKKTLELSGKELGDLQKAIADAMKKGIEQAAANTSKLTNGGTSDPNAPNRHGNMSKRGGSDN